MYARPEAPTSIGGVLDNGFKLMKASFGQVVGLSIVANFISQMPSVAMMSSLDANGLPQFGMGLMLAVVIAMLLSTAFYGAIVGRMNSVHMGREMSVGEAMNLGFGCMLPLIGLFILFTLAIMAGSILLLVPGVILSVSLMFAPYILVIDRGGIVESLKRSHKLVWGNWWRTAAILTVAVIILMVCYVLIGFVAGVSAAVDPESIGNPTFSLTETVLNGLIGGIVTPVFYALSLAVFYDLKLRREGDDLANRIEAEPSPA